MVVRDVRTPADAGDALDSFQIVEGRVLAAALVRSGGYLNFGADYKTDFTLSFSREALQRLLRPAYSIERLEMSARAKGREDVHSCSADRGGGRAELLPCETSRQILFGAICVGNADPGLGGGNTRCRESNRR